jgi:hypothetical protein
MVNVRGLGRLGMLALGLGIGAAVAHSPVASADSSTDWLSSIDSLVSGGALPAPAVPELNLAISFDGYSLVSDGDAYASTESGEYGLAIAYGDGAYADAEGGIGDYALADGTNAGAYAGDPSNTDDNFDTAIDIGNNSSDNDYSSAYDGSYDSAIQIGNNTDKGEYDGAYVYDGNHDSAIQIGSNTGNYDGVDAEHGNYDTTMVDGNYTGNYFYSFAGDGNDNLADSFGNQSEAEAGGLTAGSDSNDNVAYVLDPTGTEGSYAEAGSNGTAGGYDLAAVLGVDGTTATATGSLMYDIVTALGNESGTAASTGGGLLGELASLF